MNTTIKDNDIRLYQYGNFVFPSTNLKVTRKLGVKNKLDSTDYSHGQIRTNKFDKDYTEDTFYNVSFLSTEYNNNQLDNIFYSKPQKIFFIEKYIKNNSQGDYRVYFAYASVFSHTDVNLDCSNDPFTVTITLRQISRRYLIEDNRLKFIKFTDLLNLNEQWEVDNGSQWEVNDNTIWEDQYNGKAVNINQLSDIDRLEFFKCCSQTGFFVYDDLFFKQEVYKIDTTAKNFIEINLAVSDSFNAYKMFSTSQGSNMLNLQSTTTNNNIIFEIEKNGILASLGNGEYIEIINNNSQSGFRITCQNIYAPPILSVFIHKNIKLYNSNTNQPINFLNLENNQTYLKWKIEKIGQTQNLFEFSNNYSIYPFFNKIEIDNILIKRNFTGNLKIKIANLPTFY